MTGSPHIIFHPRGVSRSRASGNGDEATLILSSSEVDSRIVAFAADNHKRYKITIESQEPQ